MNYTETEKRYIAIMENNAKHFNDGRRKKLMINYYVAGGNKVLVIYAGVTVAADLTIQEAHCFVWGFITGRESK